MHAAPLETSVHRNYYASTSSVSASTQGFGSPTPSRLRQTSGLTPSQLTPSAHEGSSSPGTNLPPPPILHSSSHPPPHYSTLQPHRSPMAQHQMNARVLSNVSSFGSLEIQHDEELGQPSPHQESPSPTALLQQSSSVLLSPGTDDLTPGSSKPTTHLSDKTPRARNTRVREGFPAMTDQRQLELSMPSAERSMTLSVPQARIPLVPEVPFIPNLAAAGNPVPPPQSINLEELNLYQLMESGNASHWAQGKGESNDQQNKQKKTPERLLDSVSSAEAANDPRLGIKHKRPNLTASTNATDSLQSMIDFAELNLVEVIGGGGFGQVWKAMWRGTPVAVKVLTGSAQSKNVPKIVLEEFAAEINLLRGMRHPNICLYMGACVDPPNRAIITELASNGSLWDALRLPLAAPFVACDGSTRRGWPDALYEPDPKHGSPPVVTSRRLPAVPPSGAWPWVLVKKVACGAARGMAYLHSGQPPILHRDLKSANILLDDSYTAKVCDFGLSRLKAQERSMTGNCGTVQWMAPEVLANQSYNEKADVFSYGIIVWELLTRQCPYDGMSAIQCALAVLNRNQRPDIPKWCPQPVQVLIRACVKKNPDERPTFAEVLDMLDKMSE